MSIGLIVERTDGVITLDEWKELIARHSDLRLRQDPFVAMNPRTGATIQIEAGEADAEFHCYGDWLPFLRYSGGTLETEYSEDYEDPDNPVRVKIALLARELVAVVRADVDDEPLDW